MIRKLQRMRVRKGFTLVELIVVIAIIGVLAAILVPTLLGMVTKAQVSSANSTAANIKKLVDVFMLQADSEGNRMSSGSTVLKITIRSSGSNPAVWTSTAAATGVFPNWKNGVTWGTGGSYTENTDKKSIKIGEALLCAVICDEFSNIRSGSIVVVLKASKCTFVAFTTGTDNVLNDAEFPTITNGDPPRSFAWNNETAGVSPSGYVIGTAPQIILGDGT